MFWSGRIVPLAFNFNCPSESHLHGCTAAVCGAGRLCQVIVWSRTCASAVSQLKIGESHMGIGEEQIDRDTRPSSNGDKFGHWWSTGPLDSATKINLIVTDIQNESLSIHIFSPGEYRLLASLNSIIHDFTPRVEKFWSIPIQKQQGRKIKPNATS